MQLERGMSMNRQKSLFYVALILIAVISMTFIPSFGQDENDHVYVIPLEGEVGVAMEQFLAAALITAQNDPQLKGIILMLTPMAAV